MKSASRYLMVAVLASSLGACSSMSDTERRTLSGAGIGAASGALIGQLATGQPLAGAAIGTAAGAAGGWLWDRHRRGE
jgi:uncharacterized membrane protein